MFTKQQYLSIAKTIHCAADKYLWDGKSDGENQSRYSCNAIFFCIDHSDSDNFYLIRDFLRDEMGFEHGTEYFIKMEEKLDDEIVQVLRYDWLKFAAMYAEEKAAEIIMLSDVFHLAADEYLSVDENMPSPGQSFYSCDSVGYAIAEITKQPAGCCKFTTEIHKFLIDAGLPLYDFGAFEDVAITKRQECRYMWLKMLAEYAESEQIEAKEFIG